MSTKPLPDAPTKLIVYTSTPNSASKKRKAEEVLPTPNRRCQWLPSRPVVMTSAIAPTHLSSPIPNFELSPQSTNAAAFASRIQRAIDSAYKSDSSTVLRSKNDPTEDRTGMTDISRNIDLTSSSSSSRHVSSTRFLTESDWSEPDDEKEGIQRTTAELNKIVEARKWLYFIDHRLQKMLQELAQIEWAATEVVRATKSMVLFAHNIHHLKEQILLFCMCQQHKVEESYGEQAILGLKLRELQEIADRRADRISQHYNQILHSSSKEINTSVCRAVFSG